MCPGDTDAAAVAKFAYSHKQSKLTYFDKQEQLLLKPQDDRYSNLFLNAYINRHAHTEYLKMIEVYSPFGIWHVFYIVLKPISTSSGLWSTVNTRKYQHIDVYIVQALISVQALVFDLAQLTCQKRFDCRNAHLGSSTILLGTSWLVQLNCGSSFAVGRHLWTYPTLNEA